MATTKQIKTQIKNANALGIANLTEKGVEIPENATTYDIMSKIAEVSGGGAKEEQEKTITITENGTTEILPDVDKALSKVTVVTDVSSGGGETELSVEYIESTGTQYIDTGIIPTNHRVVAKFQYTNSNDDKAPAFFGNYNSNHTKGFSLTWYQNAWVYEGGMSYEGVVSNITHCMDLQEIDFNNYEGKFLINGVECGNTNGTVDISQTMPIFTKRDTDGTIPSSVYSSVRLYYFKIYDRETQELVRDFIPSIDSEGIICLYDNVTETYFYNQGEGDFIGRFVESELKEVETLIDESGVLEDTEGTITEKVEGLIDKAEELDVFMNITNGASLFKGAKTFPTKAVVNLPNAGGLSEVFSYWNTEPIPIVEELTVNAPNIKNYGLGSMFYNNYGVKKVVLNLSDNCTSMTWTFRACRLLKEIILNFSTKNVIAFGRTFQDATGLKKIVGDFDFSSATEFTNIFYGCGNLEEVFFAPNTLSHSISLSSCSKLTNESVQSIIDGLATVETAQTLTLNSAITLTDEQKATINSKGWTLAQ